MKLASRDRRSREREAASCSAPWLYPRIEQNNAITLTKPADSLSDFSNAQPLIKIHLEPARLQLPFMRCSIFMELENNRAKWPITPTY